MSSYSWFEARESELQKITTELQEHISKLQENIAGNTSFSTEVNSTNNEFIQPRQVWQSIFIRMKMKCMPTVELLSRTSMFDTKDFF